MRQDRVDTLKHDAGRLERTDFVRGEPTSVDANGASGGGYATWAYLHGEWFGPLVPPL